ncbi:MAG: phospholipid carrier-dependent glycosyltransferase, partial [Candidatus Moranbacteria bacterium]|nr:phospholipid carrier-dependent glycosyltransferase [Candidatus Moranbacteria bacterium]
MKKIIHFIIKNKILILLITYSFIILCYNINKITLNGDELIYSIVAKESLEHNSWLTFYYKNNLWFEKPPLIIWLAMLSFKFIGQTEFAARFFIVIFGIIGVLVTYYFTYTLFKNKNAALFSGFYLISSPLYLFLSKSLMMDVPLSICIALSMLGLWKVFKGHNQWLMFSAFFIGVGILVKGILGLLPVLIFISLIFVLKINFSKTILKSKYLTKSLLIFIILILPWHLFMTFKHGNNFWNSYFLYHHLERFNTNIHEKFTGKSDFFFFEVKFLEHINTLEIILFILIIYFIFNFKKYSKYKKQIYFLTVYSMVILLFFSFSNTRFSHYIAPILIPISIFFGWMLNEIYKNNKKLLLAIAIISLLNVFQYFSLKVIQVGTFNTLIAYILNNFNYLLKFLLLFSVSSYLFFLYI